MRCCSAVRLIWAVSLAIGATTGVGLGQTATGPVWIPLGPRPTAKGQVEGIADGEVTGAVRVILPSPLDADTVYIGTVNGGVWKTGNARAPLPTWSPLTDSLASLSIGALAYDTGDQIARTLVVGIGNFSSFDAGGPRAGVFRSVDQGQTWTPLGDSSNVVGLNVSAVVARGPVIVVAANDADQASRAGIWRTPDVGKTWKQLSGFLPSGLPVGGSIALTATPTDPPRLYANAGKVGIFASDDLGATWHDVSSDGIRNILASADNVKIATGTSNHVYLAIDVSNHLSAVFHSSDAGASWNGMDLPAATAGGIHPGAQGGTHLSLAVDPHDPTLLYIGGDCQPRPFPNSIGAHDYTGRLFRGDSTKGAGLQWVHITHLPVAGVPKSGTATGSAPHADSRAIAFDVSGDLLEGDDGGIYRRTKPSDATGDWLSMNGNLQVAELHSAAWDSLAHTALAGAQDTGTPAEDSLHAEVHERGDE